MKRFILLLFILSLCAQTGLSQNDSIINSLDTVQQEKAYEHIPKRSALWALAPGMGQLYNEIGYRKYAGKKNRAWWKIPIVWGGLGACGYYWYDNFSNARYLKQEILYRREFGDSTVGDPSKFAGYSSESELINGYIDSLGIYQKGFDLRAKRRDIFLFATIGVFALQMIEAFVDGHFVSFDVSEDLSMSWYPKTFDRNSIGVGLNFNFKAPSNSLAQKPLRTLF